MTDAEYNEQITVLLADGPVTLTRGFWEQNKDMIVANAKARVANSRKPAPAPEPEKPQQGMFDKMGEKLQEYKQNVTSSMDSHEDRAELRDALKYQQEARRRKLFKPEQR